MTKPGHYMGRHYSEFVNDVISLKRSNRLAEAEDLLINLVVATEEESRHEGYGVAPWYYEQLAIIYKKLGSKRKEIEILERFKSQKHANGVKPPMLLERLAKLKSQL